MSLAIYVSITQVVATSDPAALPSPLTPSTIPGFCVCIQELDSEARMKARLLASRFFIANTHGSVDYQVPVGQFELGIFLRHATCMNQVDRSTHLSFVLGFMDYITPNTRYQVPTNQAVAEVNSYDDRQMKKKTPLYMVVEAMLSVS